MTTNYKDEDWRLGFVQDQTAFIQGVLANRVRGSGCVHEQSVDMQGLTELCRPMGRIGQMVINNAKKLNADRTREIAMLKMAMDNQQAIVEKMNKGMKNVHEQSRRRIDQANDDLSKFRGVDKEIEEQAQMYADLIEIWDFKTIANQAKDCTGTPPIIEVGWLRSLYNKAKNIDPQKEADDLFAAGKELVEIVEAFSALAKRFIEVPFLRDNNCKDFDRMYSLWRKLKDLDTWPNNVLVLQEDIEHMMLDVRQMLKRVESYSRSTIQNNKSSDQKQEEKIKQARNELVLLTQSYEEALGLEYWCKRLASFAGFTYTEEDLCELAWQLDVKYKNHLQMVYLIDRGSDKEPNDILAQLETYTEYNKLDLLEQMCK